jgi:hypothetical protein
MKWIIYPKNGVGGSGFPEISVVPPAGSCGANGRQTLKNRAFSAETAVFFRQSVEKP